MWNCPGMPPQVWMIQMTRYLILLASLGTETIGYSAFKRRIVTELPGNACWKLGALTLIVLAVGATFVGSVREFSSAGFSEVSTVVLAGPWMVFTPLSLMSVDSSDFEVLTTFRMTSPVFFVRLAEA